MTFTDQFTPLSFPLMGLVRFPTVTVSSEDKAVLKLKEDASNRDALRALAWQGYQDRVAKGWFKTHTRAQVVERFKTEFATFDKTGVVDYLLLVWDIVRWAQQQGIVTGWGRGSAGGSLVNACLGITKVDPLRYHLDFPRFLSEARMKPVVKDGVTYVDGKSAPDIDMDFQYGRRTDVVKYVETKYAGHTAKISTRMELTGKMALKDTLKVYAGYDEVKAKQVSDLIEARFGKGQTLHEARDKNPDIQTWLKASPDHVRYYAIAMAIEGLAIGKGQHPSGVFISYEPIEGNIPVELAKEKDGVREVVTSYDMETVAGLGIKVDILAVRSLDLVANTAALAGEPMESLDLESPVIYDYLKTHSSYVGLFQIEEGVTKEATVKIGPRHLTDLSAVLAISRPGAMKYIDQFAAYVKTGVIKPFHPAIDTILASTGGALIMQEQITEVCREVFGLSGIDADSVRYAVGKKKREEMVKWEGPISAGGRKRSIPETIIKAFWDVCNASADYSFCKCLDPRTMVHTGRGPLMMADVHPGDTVYAYDTDSGSNHYVRVLAVHEGERMLCRVRLASGHEMVCSQDHKVLCIDDLMRTVQDAFEQRMPVVVQMSDSCYAGRLAPDTRIVSIAEDGVRQTLDLEVAHPDHLFYANGIAVSNSHAVEYACLTAATIYYKARHPQAFYLSMLKLASDEPNAIAYMNGVIGEMRAAGIQLLPPDLIKSESDFAIQDGHVRFGLSHIKGISTATMAKVASFKRDFESKFAIFEAAKAAKLDIRTLTGLIMCGCLDSIIMDGSTRAKLALEAQLYNLLTSNEKVLAKRYADEYHHDLLALVKGVAEKRNEKGKELVKPSRMNTLRRDYADHWRAYQAQSANEELTAYLAERAYLGFSFSGDLHTIYSKRVTGLTPLKDIGRFKGSKESFRAVAFIEEGKLHMSAKGSPYWRAEVFDDEASVRIMVHGQERIDACQSYNEGLPKAGDIVTISGQLSADGGIVFADSCIVQPSPLKPKAAETI